MRGLQKRIGEIDYQGRNFGPVFCTRAFQHTVTDNSGYGSLSPIIKINLFMKIKFFCEDTLKAGSSRMGKNWYVW